MNDIYSFYQLISKYQIEIPIIQRDYAQGRNNPKAKDVRKSMVKDMIAAVNGEKKLFFDFVYGRIDGNKFIPFDGQQRLTTLFLFHKYIFEKCQSSSTCDYKSNCICRDILLRFSYATRQSSREFCEQLVANSVIPSKDYSTRIRNEYAQKLSDKQEAEKEKKTNEHFAKKTDWMSSYIKNQAWFYSDWEKDPTIVGMLTMLDEIHNQFTQKEINDYKPLAEKLTNGCSCPITFHFVDMGEHKLSDETYVKMNARGKTLTPFENFKASLEQYLEEKNEEGKALLSRLKGEYDESKQKYSGIDGIWLDLFWEVTNEEKQENEGKELPDSLMMSFFNRHFMNVWRCWYENNSKTEKERNSLNDEQKKEQDEFNKRIQEEMPLYPTKDNFVSFDIYEYVIGKCGVDVCLSPIFNIWDALCEKDNSILSNCQAVWNRKEEEPKWNLYFGDKNKDNRETYPSRVAFYALLRYFGIENKETKTTLLQWMRIVWNIIENSTIDSSDTYQAALRLIDKLSEECRDIHNALANRFEDFQLGSQYHAKEQVAEEIAKAQQILDENGALRKYNGSCKKADGSDYQTWEEIIIEAEKYAFFKGAIRFLFTDGEGNIDWEKFDTKWGNAQKYFDENGVKDEGNSKYKTNVLLLKAVLFHVNDISKIRDKERFVFDNEHYTWKEHILLNTDENWKTAVNEILMGNLEIEERGDDCLMYKNLYNTNLLNYIAENQKSSRIKNRKRLGNHWAIYPYYKDGILLDNDEEDDSIHRNKLLSELISENKVESGQKIKDYPFLKGWDINFKYKNAESCDFYFQWNRNDYIYLTLENFSVKIKDSSKSYETERYFCFNTSKIMGKDDLEKKLNELIQEEKRQIIWQK